MPRWPALTFAAVGERVFVVYASFASGAEPQMMGWRHRAREPKSWPSGMPRRTAARGAGRAGWSGTAPRRVRSTVDGRGDAVEVWLVDVGLDELIHFVLESEPLIEEH
jgi:hypothetical protein